MALATTSLASGTAMNSAKAPYPPALTGMRGSHPGSFEVAHRLGREGEDAPIADGISEDYDLVVVGAGLSGLAAARKYQMEQPDARILILDNHDDFGGHAKRNEFTVNGHFLIGYGGSQTLEDPEDFEDDVWEILDDIGFESDRFETAYDRSFYSSRGMQPRMFAQKLDKTENVHFPFTLSTISGVKPKPKAEDFEALPLSEQDRAKLQELLLAPRIIWVIKTIASRIRRRSSSRGPISPICAINVVSPRP
jgi:spermidine dehydrogenase